MYRDHNEYEKMASLAIQIYEDYGFSSFPLDPYLLCKKMGIKLVAYSSMDEEMLSLSRKFSKDGYSISKKSCLGEIFFNDTKEIENPFRIEFTILHEIKHLLCKDLKKEAIDEEMADYFARYMKCPIPYLVVQNITYWKEISREFGVSKTAAINVSTNVLNRKKRYGQAIFASEVPLLETILGSDFDIHNFDIVK